MPLGLNDIRESGLLELYVLGQLSASEEKEVSDALSQYPELKQDLIEIESAFKKYADAHAVAPQNDIKSRIMNEIKESSKPIDNSDANSGGGFNVINLLWFAVIAALSVAYYLKQNDYNDLQNRYSEQVAACDSLTTAHNNRLQLLDHIQDPSTRIIPIAATEKYPETNIYFFENNDQEKNIIQIQNLPQIAENESFQLWSLKDNTDPIPLDVFDSTQDLLLEVAFVENSNAYAITIEPKGGSQQPNLDQLIGVFSI